MRQGDRVCWEAVVTSAAGFSVLAERAPGDWLGEPRTCMRAFLSFHCMFDFMFHSGNERLRSLRDEFFSSTPTRPSRGRGDPAAPLRPASASPPCVFASASMAARGPTGFPPEALEEIVLPDDYEQLPKTWVGYQMARPPYVMQQLVRASSDGSPLRSISASWYLLGGGRGT